MSSAPIEDDALRWAEAHLAGILAITVDAVISIDEKHRIVLFNHGAEATFGYHASEVIGQPLDLLIPEQFRSTHGDHIRDFDMSGTVARRMGDRRQIWALHKDGHEFPAEASITKHDAGGERVFTVVLRDITAHKQLEHELEVRVAERTAELQALLDALPDGVIKLDMERRILLANVAMAKLVGYSNEELVGRHGRMLVASDADGEALVRAWALWEAGTVGDPVHINYKRKDGTIFTAVVRGNLVRNEQGEMIGRVAIIRDISENLQREKALRQSQRMEAFGQLTGGFAHDFNNLLTVISGNQELLEMRLKEAKDLALLNRAKEATEMGARLTSRLLAFARRRPLEPTPLDLNEQIAAMVDLLRRSIGDHVTLTTKLSPQLPLVLADPSEIENAVLNLAINARDAMPNGGTIVIETSEHSVETQELGEGKLAPGDYVRLSVSDTGEGMTPEVQSRAFEPFFTTKVPGKGTGLGLSTIYGVVRQLGGTVQLYSEIGHGTTVNIYLPRAATAREAGSMRKTPASVPVFAGEKVLLVEDNPAVREVARGRLEELGFSVEEIETGAAALELLQSRADTFHVVLSDVMMPGGVSGYDVARWVAANEPGLKVLLTSGYPGEIANGGAGDAARFPLLRKPYSRTELAHALFRVLYD